MSLLFALCVYCLLCSNYWFIFFIITFMIVLLLCMFCFLFCVFCVFVLFCVLFLTYIVVSFILVYKFTDHCHRVETKLQVISYQNSSRNDSRTYRLDSWCLVFVWELSILLFSTAITSRPRLLRASLFLSDY